MVKSPILFFIGIFLLVQLLGLYIGNEYLSLIKAGQAEPVFEEPERIENTLFLIFYILAATFFIILIIRYRKILLRVVEIIVIFFASLYTFDFLFPFQIFYIPLSLFLALSLIIWRIKRPSFLNQNLAIAFSLPSVGAIIGASLGIIPSLLLIVLLSLYDFISVFVTKHMIYIAKEITKLPTAFSLALPYKFKKPISLKVGKKKIRKSFHVFQLGSGDLVIPLIFSVSVLASFSLKNALFSILGSALMLTLIIYFTTKKPRALPAIPLISVGTLAGFLVSLIL